MLGIATQNKDNLFPYLKQTNKQTNKKQQNQPLINDEKLKFEI